MGSRDTDLSGLALPETPQEGLLAALAELEQARIQQILIVDDDEATRRLIRRILHAHGQFGVQEASSGEEALAVSRRSPPHLVILHLMMPDKDGFTVLDRLKDQPETGNVPVIVVTAKDLTPEERKRLEGRIARLMTKGDTMDEDLLREIGRVLR
jgi:threonine synthase